MNKKEIEQNELNKLTTQADEFYTLLESETLSHFTEDAFLRTQDELKDFLDKIVDYLETQGGRVGGVSYHGDEKFEKGTFNNKC